MRSITKIAGVLVATTLVGAGLLVTNEVINSPQEVTEVCEKPIEYKMTVTDGDKSAPVTICEDELGLVAKKADLLTKTDKNELKSESGVSPSVEALLIAYNEPEFAESLATELLKKYDSEQHAFIGAELDYDLFEQRALFFKLASMKCNGACSLEGETVNEWAYNLLTKKN
jgi:hypothetical protein